MKIEITAPVWKHMHGAKGINRASLGGITFDRSSYAGFQRSTEHKKMLEAVGKYIRAGAVIHYTEDKPFPHTIAKVIITDGIETR